MKKIKTLILLALSIMCLGGCTTPQDKENKIIEDSLNKKYGESFEVSGGPHADMSLNGAYIRYECFSTTGEYSNMPFQVFTSHKISEKILTYLYDKESIMYDDSDTDNEDEILCMIDTYKGIAAQNENADNIQELLGSDAYLVFSIYDVTEQTPANLKKFSENKDNIFNPCSIFPRVGVFVDEKKLGTDNREEVLNEVLSAIKLCGEYDQLAYVYFMNDLDKEKITDEFYKLTKRHYTGVFRKIKSKLPILKTYYANITLDGEIEVNISK